jgi:hypothetical protein
MAKFLTTRGIIHNIEELIEKAQKEVFIVTPYIKFSSTLFDRVRRCSNKGINIIVIYGKAELNDREEKLLKELNCDIFYKENLHAKCYANEKEAIVTSLNLHSYSEAHNEEMGVLLDGRQDKEAYLECIEAVKFLMDSARKINVVKQNRQAQKTGQEYDYVRFKTEWLRCLKHSFPNMHFREKGNYVNIKGFSDKGAEFSNEYGFATIKLNVDYERGLEWKNWNYQRFQEELFNYRLYWNSPYNKVSLYHAKDIKFKSIQEEIQYCADGLNMLLSYLKRINVL